MEYTSPVVRGLMNGFSLGNMLQQQQMDKRRLDMQEQQQGFDNQSRQVTLLSQLAEMGARPVTQSDQYEADGGQHVNFGEDFSITSSPTDLPARMLAMPGTGQRFVLPSTGERDERAARQTQRSLLDRNRAAAEAHATTLTQNEAGAARNLEATGIQLPAELLQRFGMQPGRKVLPTQMDDLMRADTYRTQVTTPKARKVINTARVQGQDGKLMSVLTYEDGTQEFKPINGTTPTRAGTGTGSGRSKAAAEPKPTFTQTVNALSTKVLEESAAGGGQTIDDALDNVDAYYQNDPQFNGAIRQQIRSKLRKMGAKDAKNPFAKEVAPKVAPKVAPNAAPNAAPKVASKANVSAFATAKGITEAQAMEEFKKSGYEVK